MPLYYPRSKSEEDFAAYHLPYDVGNEDGEPVIKERGIRIVSKPTFTYGPAPNGNVLTVLCRVHPLDWDGLSEGTLFCGPRHLSKRADNWQPGVLIKNFFLRSARTLFENANKLLQ